MRVALIFTLFFGSLALLGWSAGRIVAEHKHAQSWDQENLKRNDVGCPTGIYSAPRGNLRLCAPTSMINDMDVTPIPKPERAEDESGEGPQEPVWLRG